MCVEKAEGVCVTTDISYFGVRGSGRTVHAYDPHRPPAWGSARAQREAKDAISRIEDCFSFYLRALSF